MLVRGWRGDEARDDAAVTSWFEDGEGDDADADARMKPASPRSRHLPAVVLGAALLISAMLSSCTAARAPAPDRSTARTAPIGTASSPAAASGSPSAVPPANTALPSAPTFPHVVALSWLDGPSAAAGVRVKEAGFVRWQGSAAGEQAELLADGAYRWVGPDGSAVGCAPQTPRAVAEKLHRRCVAFDSAGNVAVTGTANALRTVWGPAGSALGAYQIAGIPVRSAASSMTLDEAVATSGVDLPGLLDFATGRLPFAGGITGDPHLITIDGVRVTSQLVGDFVARSGDPVHRIQFRVEPMPYQSEVSYVSAAAIGVPGHTIELSLAGGLRIDGSVVDATHGFVQMRPTDGPAIGVWPPDAGGVGHVVVLWPDGSTVSLSADPSLGITLVARLPTAAVGGLFGVRTATGNGGASTGPTPPAGNVPDVPALGSRGDFTPRSGSGTTGSSSGQVIESWRVPAGDSLFPDDAPIATPTAASATISPTAILAAEKTCVAGGITESEDLAACVFDVSRTGDDGYVVPHRELATAATSPVVPASMTDDWPASTVGAVVSARDIGLGELIQDAVAAGARSYYRVTLVSPTAMEIKGLGCSAAQAARRVARGAAAARIFDSAGHPVSTRVTPCGRDRTGTLAAGVYYLLVAGPSAGPAAGFRLRLQSV
ncbi:hypothetical protein ABIB25_002695 [Nakamurella sp. UYEF19]|uniref:hypothetical protein n=1 Tax=Nakamurella sp. UYEF19 TaxID=1756392 RepID=UPI00339302EC